MAFSPPIDHLQGNSYMNFRNEELKHLDELDPTQQSFMKLSKEYAELSNFYMTQPLTPLDPKL